MGTLVLASTVSAQVLYDNGPLATGTVHSAGTVAPAGTQWSELQRENNLSNGLISLSVVYNGATPFRLADDFTVGPEGWNVTGITVYGFQSGSSTTSTLTSGVVRIWNGRPDSGTASVIAGDLTTNRLASATFTNIYRTGRQSGSTTRPIMAATLSLNVALDPGTYWIEYGLTGSLSGAVFSPFVTVPNQWTVPGANSLFFGNNSIYNQVIDTSSSAPLAVPFQVLGQPVPEPATVLALAGAFGAVVARRRRRR